MIRSILHSIMGLFIILSAGGFNIHMHYCHDQLIDVGIFNPAQTCCNTNNAGMASCCTTMAGNDHCEDKHLHMEALDDYTVASPLILTDTRTSITAPFAMQAFVHAPFIQTSNHPLPNPHLQPPFPPNHNRQPMLQVFLI